MILKPQDVVVALKWEQRAVVIDLRKHGQILEDFYDRVLGESRRNEPRESLDIVKSRLGETPS